MNYQPTKEGFEKRLLQIQKTQDERNAIYYSWLKNLINISIALFGLIISLNTSKVKTENETIFFVISIVSLGLGILFALITLYGEVNALDKLRNFYNQQSIKYLDGKSDLFEFENIPVNKIYTLSSYLFVVFYIISLVSLILYSTYEGIKSVS